jgi:hypothetical protein
MKNFVLLVAVFCLTGLASQVYSQDRLVVTRHEVVTLEFITPADLVKGVGDYVIDVGENVLKGAGKIISAPFKAKMYIPQPRFYRWERGYWVPSRFYEIPDAKIRNGGMYYLPFYDSNSSPERLAALLNH